jgi:excisionase family DNA binding protein
MFDSSAAKQPYFSVRQAAAKLGVSEITIRRMIAGREIEHLRIGSRTGRIVFSESQINNYLRGRTITAQAA